MLVVATIALSGCTSYLSAPLEKNRIGAISINNQGIASPDVSWGLHVLAADELGQINPLIYRSEIADDGINPYRCHLVEEAGESGSGIAVGAEGFNDCQINRIVSYLKASFDNFEDKSNGRSIFPPRCEQEAFTLMIFIHGGLNITDGSLDRVKQDTELALKDCVYPIFLNWEAGPTTSYLDQITFIRGGKRINTSPPEGEISESEQAFRTTNYLNTGLAPVYFISDVAEAVARAPVSWATQGITYLAQLRGLVGLPEVAEVSLQNCENTYQYSSCITGTLGGSIERDEPPGWRAIGPTNNVFIDGDATLSANITGSVVPFVLAPLRFVSTPFVDSIGETIWNNLLRTTFATIETDRDYLNQRDRSLKAGLQSPSANGSDRICATSEERDGTAANSPTGAFFRLAAALQDFLCEKNGTNRNHEKIRVNLVAHSMGAIIGNELINGFDLDYDNIVYMGAASSIRHFSSTVIPYIERRKAWDETENSGSKSDVRFYNLMLHPWHEAREARIYGAAPAGSLLVWIDSMYEHSDSTFDRTLGQWDNVRQTKWRFPEKAQEHMFFKVFGNVEGMPKSHGAFTDIECNNTPSLHFAYWDEGSWGHPDLLGEEDRLQSIVCQ